MCERCALCGGVIREQEAGIGIVEYCPRCGVEFPPSVPLPELDVKETYITTDGRYLYSFQGDGWWLRNCLRDGFETVVRRVFVRDDIMTLYEYQQREAEKERVARLYGSVKQLAFRLT